MDARPGNHRTVEIALPGSGLLLAAPGGTRRALGGQRLAVRPSAFPGVDQTDVLTFLDRHSTQ